MIKFVDITTSTVLEHEASLGWHAILLSAGCVFAAGYFGILVPDFVMTRCGVQNNLLSNIIGFSVFSVLAIHQLMAIVISRVSWSDTHISYRSWNLKKYTVPVTDVIDTDHATFVWKTVKFKHTPTFCYSPLSVSLEKFEEYAFRTRLHSHAHEFYFPAERQVIYDGANCGCMNCLTIFPKADIQTWVGEVANKAFTKDRVECPACNQWETVVTDQAKVRMTVDELILAAKKFGIVPKIVPYAKELKTVGFNEKIGAIKSRASVT